MDGVKRIARAYYDRASREEKSLVRQYFEKFDKNKDQKITLEVFKESASDWLSHEAVFEYLDTDKDGYLDFEEAIALYYIDKKISPPVCKGCHFLITHPYFSCMSCLNKHPNTYDLCCDCFRDGRFVHEHSSKEFMDQFSLVSTFGRRTAKGEMDKLRDIAKAHYEAGSPQVQALAKKFFESMDTDEDQLVDLEEFLSFMRQEDYEQMRNPSFFNELDENGNGKLDFWDVMTIYYILKSGRPFCDTCGTFIPGIYFSCVECFKNPHDPFNICSDCYQSEKCKHNHGGRTQFLDNFTLLEAKRDPALAQETGVTQNNQLVTAAGRRPVSSSNQSSFNEGRSNSNAYVATPSTSTTAIVPANNNRRAWNVAFKAFELALGIGNISTTLCTIL